MSIVKMPVKHSAYLLENFETILTAEESVRRKSYWYFISRKLIVKTKTRLLSIHHNQVKVKPIPKDSGQWFIKHVSKVLQQYQQSSSDDRNGTDDNEFLVLKADSECLGDKLLNIKINKDFLQLLRTSLSFPMLRVNGVIYSEKLNREYPRPTRRNSITWKKSSEYRFDLLVRCGDSDGENKIALPTLGTQHLFHTLTKMQEQRRNSLRWRRLRIQFTVTLEWTTYSIHLNGNSLLIKLFENQITKDFSIVAGNGFEMKCHKCVLAVNSPVLAALVSTKNTKESTSGKVEMAYMSEKGLKQFVRYMYGLKIFLSELDCSMVRELFQAADAFELTQLRNTLSSFIIQMEDDWFTPNETLEMYFHMKNLGTFIDVERFLLSLISSRSSEIVCCDRFQDLSEAEVDNLLLKIRVDIV